MLICDLMKVVVSVSDLDVFFVVRDSGEKLLPSHQLSKQPRSFLQTFDQRFDVVVQRLPVDLQKHTHTHVNRQTDHVCF